MRFIGTFLFALVSPLSAVPADAAERAAVIRAGDLKAQPFLDAATSDRVAAKQQVTIIKRQGGWVQVQSEGKTGWVRMLNLRLEADAARAGAAKPNSSASLLRTGSSGKTVTTGVKGLGEEDIRNATVNLAELAVLATLVVEPPEAIANAQQSGLKENSVGYLKKEKGK